MTSAKKLIQVGAMHQRLVKDLLQARLMIRGTFAETFRKCGKPTCWCAHAEGHPYLRITWTEKAQAKTKAIKKEDVAWAQRATDNYRKFRKCRKQLREVQKQINELLNLLEEEIIKQSKQEIDYL